jgi:hypothetical protein
MLRIKLSSLFVLFTILVSSAQLIIMKDSARYEKKAISLEEANVLTSFYMQNGNHSAVTGGIGTEALFDNSNIIDLKFSRQSVNGKKTTFGAEFGIDYYTSASSDNIDFRKSSASSQDVRFYPSLNYTVEDQSKKQSKGGHLSFSKEYDYTSFGGGVNFSKTFNSGMTDFQGKVNGFYDTYLEILPSEFNTSSGRKQRYTSAPRQSYEGSLSLSHILNSKFQAALILDLAYQTGLLSTPFHRVYTTEGELVREVLPSSRIKIPVGIRANYFVTDAVIVRTFYRYFKDNWGMVAHTMQLELPIKVSQKISIAPHARYHMQSGIDYFDPYSGAAPSDIYRTSDYDLSSFNSITVGANFRILPLKTVVKNYAFSAIEIRPSYYHRSDGMVAGMIAIHAQFKKM